MLEKELRANWDNVFYPEPEPEVETFGEEVQPVDDPVLLAAGPSGTMTDAGPGIGAGRPVDTIKAIDPTMRQQLADFLQAGFERLGASRNTARKNAQTLAGGGSSNLPIGMGLADIVPFLGTALQTEEAAIAGGEAVEAVKRGDLGEAGVQAGMAAVGMIPGAVGTVKGVRAAAKGAKALAPKAGEMAENYLQRTGQMLNVVPPGPSVVSTRLPTAKKATEDPLANRLVIDLQSTKADPEAFTHNVGLVRQYPNFVSQARTPDQQAEDFITQVKDNLLWLHDKVPEGTRQRSKLWYDGARNIADRFSSDYGVPDQAVSGVLAVLSPQKDWFMNVSLGQRVLDIATKQKGARWDSSMDEMAKVIWSKPQYAPMVDAIRGKTLGEITDPGLKAMWLRTYDQAKLPREHQIVSPEGDFVGVRTNANGSPTKTGWGSLNEIGKAIVILEDPTLPTISTNLGQQHKVRNFYNNIYAPQDPAGHVTIDTHAVAAGLLRPLSGNSREVLHNFGSGVVGEGGPKNSSITGVQGTYGLYAEAYRRAAQERGLLPREMQSITWEAVRGLYPDTFKSQAKNVQSVDNVWLQYRQGKLSLEEARNEVLRIAGGINAPEWERAGLRPGPAQEVQPTANPRQLPGAGVPGGSSSSTGGNNPTAGNTSKVKRNKPIASGGNAATMPQPPLEPQ
jgi:hypothetical protein